MISIGLSFNSGIKLLEKTLKFRVSNRFQNSLYDYAPAAEVAEANTAAVTEKPIGLRIARTTMPDERLDFNQTFLHIRQELDGFYKERNPIFSNMVQPGKSLKQANA